MLVNPICFDEVEELLLAINSEKPSGRDNLNGKLLRIAAHLVTNPITHIFNQSLMWGVCPQMWKEVKVIPLPKITKANLTDINSHPISILPVLVKLMEKIVFNQIQSYLSENALNTNVQHAYRNGHLTCTVLHLNRWEMTV